MKVFFVFYNTIQKCWHRIWLTPVNKTGSHEKINFIGGINNSRHSI